MLIQQRRIRTLERHLSEEYQGQELRVGVVGLEQHRARLQRAGFSPALTVGERVLPVHVGPVSRFNAEGKFVVRRDLKKEEATRMIEWHWQEFRGRDDRVEKSDFKYITYMRYPRDQIPPPSVELAILQSVPGEGSVVTDPIVYDDEHRELLIHAINLCLEHFGECRVFTRELVPVFKGKIRRLNWSVLPPGNLPWEQFREQIQPIVNAAKKGNRGVIIRRLETINAYEPQFRAVGNGGFTGYIVMGFPKLNLYVCESIRYGNATYVFEEDWERLSQMSKAQILDENLQKARIVHTQGWPEGIRRLLG